MERLSFSSKEDPNTFWGQEDNNAYVGGRDAYWEGKDRDDCDYVKDRHVFQWNCGYSYSEWEDGESDFTGSSL